MNMHIFYEYIWKMVYCFCVCRTASNELASAGQSMSLPEGAVPPLPARHHPPVTSSSSADSAPGGATALDHNLGRLVADGFDEVNARRALKLAKNNIELARGILNEFVPSLPSSSSSSSSFR